MLEDSSNAAPSFRSSHRLGWPTKPKGNKELEGDPQARLKADTRARDSALAELMDLVMHAGLPVAAALGKGANASALQEVIGHGKRASTISKRVRAWRKASQYFEVRH